MERRTEKEVFLDALWWVWQYAKALGAATLILLFVLMFLAWLDGGL